LREILEPVVIPGKKMAPWKNRKKKRKQFAAAEKKGTFAAKRNETNKREKINQKENFRK
jgi:hypothetical protein